MLLIAAFGQVSITGATSFPAPGVCGVSSVRIYVAIVQCWPVLLSTRVCACCAERLLASV
eukprot:6006425-Amphidinium_carterae.1